MSVLGGKRTFEAYTGHEGPRIYKSENNQLSPIDLPLRSLNAVGLKTAKKDQRAMIVPIILALSEVGPAAVSTPPERAIVIQGEKPQKEKRVCTTEIPTGSFIPKRICRTIGEVDASTAPQSAHTDAVLRQLEEDQRTVHILPPR